jgi:hypothetical protein
VCALRVDAFVVVPCGGCLGGSVATVLRLRGGSADLMPCRT